MITWGSHYWPWFLIISGLWLIAGFGIPEIIALITQVATHTDNTLSRYAQNELGLTGEVNRHNIAWGISLFAWVLITTILTWHIWFKLGG